MQQKFWVLAEGERTNERRRASSCIPDNPSFYSGSHPLRHLSNVSRIFVSWVRCGFNCSLQWCRNKKWGCEECVWVWVLVWRRWRERERFLCSKARTQQYVEDSEWTSAWKRKNEQNKNLCTTKRWKAWASSREWRWVCCASDAVWPDWAIFESSGRQNFWQK